MARVPGTNFQIFGISLLARSCRADKGGPVGGDPPPPPPRWSTQSCLCFKSTDVTLICDYLYPPESVEALGLWRGIPRDHLPEVSMSI